jgi:transcriptional regulator with XRE-family HTH domain
MDRAAPTSGLAGVFTRDVAQRIASWSAPSQIRNQRRQAGLSIFELATAASLSVGMLSKVENGRISPSLATLRFLAEALGVPIATFFVVFEE